MDTTFEEISRPPGEAGDALPPVFVLFELLVEELPKFVLMGA